MAYSTDVIRYKQYYRPQYYNSFNYMYNNVVPLIKKKERDIVRLVLGIKTKFIYNSPTYYF